MLDRMMDALPYPMPPAAPAPASAPATTAAAATVGEASLAEPSVAAPPSPPPGFGVETPMPGREREYEAFKAQEQEGFVPGPAYAPPPIDAERKSRSPGLRNNFYDVPTSDFKRPYGTGRSAPPSAPGRP